MKRTNIQRAPGRTEADFVRLEAALATRTQDIKEMEDANEKRRVLHKKCLDESLQLQKRLRFLTHRILAAQEDDRKKISQQLQNEIAQRLLGINVRLLALQKESRGRTKRFKKDIASTQQAVVESTAIVQRAARKLVKHEPQAPDMVAPLSSGVNKPPQRGRPGKPRGDSRAGQ